MAAIPPLRAEAPRDDKVVALIFELAYTCVWQLRRLLLGMLYKGPPC